MDEAGGGMGRDLTAGGRIGAWRIPRKNRSISEGVYLAALRGLIKMADDSLEEELDSEEPAAKLAAWHKVYEGLSDEEIAEVEAIALSRNFFRGDAG